jgi:hypothetical protein
LAETKDDEQWKTVVQTIRENMADESMLHDKKFGRPVRPNRDNYEAFRGPQWNPKTSTLEAMGFPSVGAAMATLLGWPENREDSVPHAHYDRCANCTKPATRNCSRCRIVKYCSRECQCAHWKKVHKASCIEAEPKSLWESLQGEVWAFHVSSTECRAICTALSQGQNIGGDASDLICYFKVYFDLAAELGGCFVVIDR